MFLAASFRMLFPKLEVFCVRSLESLVRVGRSVCSFVQQSTDNAVAKRTNAI